MRVGLIATMPAERDKTSSHNSRRSRQQQWPNLDDVKKLDDDKRGWRNLESNRDQPEVCGEPERGSNYHTSTATAYWTATLERIASSDSPFGSKHKLADCACCCDASICACE